jgi:hypothetical protein
MQSRVPLLFVDDQIILVIFNRPDRRERQHPILDTLQLELHNAKQLKKLETLQWEVDRGSSPQDMPNAVVSRCSSGDGSPELLTVGEKASGVSSLPSEPSLRAGAPQSVWRCHAFKKVAVAKSAPLKPPVQGKTSAVGYAMQRDFWEEEEEEEEGELREEPRIRSLLAGPQPFLLATDSLLSPTSHLVASSNIKALRPPPLQVFEPHGWEAQDRRGGNERRPESKRRLQQSDFSESPTPLNSDSPAVVAVGDAWRPGMHTLHCSPVSSGDDEAYDSSLWRSTSKNRRHGDPNHRRPRFSALSFSPASNFDEQVDDSSVFPKSSTKTPPGDCHLEARCRVVQRGHDMFSPQSSARKLYGEEISLHPNGETKRKSSNRGTAVGPAGDQQSLNSRDKASAVGLPLPYLFFPLVFSVFGF